MQRKGSVISAIFSGYRRALRLSQDRYGQLYTERAGNAVAFYEDFLKDLIIGYEGFRQPALRRQIRREAESFFDRDEIQFVAIDGSCNRDAFTDFMVFSSVAYGVRGEISLRGDPPTLQYKRRSMDEDVSFVSYVPVPFAEIADVADPDRLEDFVVTEQDRLNLSSIHTTLMQLAEVYLAYEMARSTAPDRPRLVLMDHSPSSIMATTEVGVKRIGFAGLADLDTRGIGLLGYGVGRRALDHGDATVVYAHPFSDDLALPSTKRFRLYNVFIAEGVRNRGQPIDVAGFAAKEGLKVEDIESHFKRNPKVVGRIAEYDRTTRMFKPRFDFQASWWDSVRLFEDICRRLFKEKDQEALIYDAPDLDDPSKTRRRWMSPDDVKFLVAIGLRALVEECWRNRVMLLGIVKDSQSRYFTRNYCGMMRHLRVYDPIDVKPLPWTDRIVLEDIAYQVPHIAVPWATVEFDSCFMTLHLGRPDGEAPARPVGVKGDVINQERLFARSLGQFFLRRRSGKAAPLMGHVVFIDRLLYPHWDLDLCEGAEVATPELGALRPFLHRDCSVHNPAQQVAMYFLDTLTRNLFPDAIGYPDPLRKADWGAKTVGRRVAQIVKDSEVSFRANPLTKTLRTIRDEPRR